MVRMMYDSISYSTHSWDAFTLLKGILMFHVALSLFFSACCVGCGVAFLADLGASSAAPGSLLRIQFGRYHLVTPASTVVSVVL